MALCTKARRRTDTSVTATVFVSLASAREAGVLVPGETIERVTGYLRDQAFDERREASGTKARATPFPALPVACIPLNSQATGTPNGSRPLSTPWKTIRKCFPARTTVTSTIPITMPCRRWFRQARNAIPNGIRESAMLSSVCNSPTDPGRKRKRIIRTRRLWRSSFSGLPTGIFPFINAKSRPR